jgi:RNA-splicing ligase RtcB
MLLVHRKGATRAFGANLEGLPERYRDLRQPVILGGSMETGSYLLVGVPSGAQSFFSTAHGSGRVMSRTKARKQWRGDTLQRDMAAAGIYVRTVSWAGLAEEAGGAYAVSAPRPACWPLWGGSRRRHSPDARLAAQSPAPHCKRLAMSWDVPHH